MNDIEYKLKVTQHLIDIAFANMKQIETIAVLTKKVFELEMRIEEMEKKQ